MTLELQVSELHLRWALMFINGAYLGPRTIWISRVRLGQKSIELGNKDGIMVAPESSETRLRVQGSGIRELGVRILGSGFAFQYCSPRPRKACFLNHTLAKVLHSHIPNQWLNPNPTPRP